MDDLNDPKTSKNMFRDPEWDGEAAPASGEDARSLGRRAVLERVPLSSISPHPDNPRVGEDPSLTGPLDAALYDGGEQINVTNAPLLRRLPGPGERLEPLRGGRCVNAARRSASSDAEAIYGYVLSDISDEEAFDIMARGHSQRELTKLEKGILAHHAAKYKRPGYQQKLAGYLDEDPSNLSHFKTAAGLFLALKAAGLLACDITSSCRDRGEHLYRIATLKEDLPLAAKLVTRCVKEEWTVEVTAAKVREAKSSPPSPTDRSPAPEPVTTGKILDDADTDAGDAAPDPKTARPTPAVAPAAPEASGAQSNSRPGEDAASSPPESSHAERAGVKRGPKRSASADTNDAEGERAVDEAVQTTASASAAVVETSARASVRFGMVTDADFALAFNAHKVNLGDDIDVRPHARVLGLDAPSPGDKIGVGRIVTQLMKRTQEGGTPGDEYLLAVVVALYWDFVVDRKAYRDYAAARLTEK